MFPSSSYHQPVRPQSPAAQMELDSENVGIPGFDPSVDDSEWNDLLSGFWIPHAPSFDAMSSLQEFNA
jgi:hypothetical protein